MRFEQLSYLEAALRTGSFRQAAKELGVSQPTITMQVQRLEEDLGVILVLRDAHGVRPTYAAERILPHVVAAIRAEHAMRQEASSLENLKVGNLRLAVVPTASDTIMPGVVKRLHDEHPSIRFEVAEGGSDMVRHGVQTGHFDAGLLTYLGFDELSDDLHYVDLLTGHLVLCVPEDHPVADKDEVTAADLAGEPLVFFSKGSILRRAFEKLVADVETNVVYTTDGVKAAQRMVQAGVGISLANTLSPYTASGDGVILVPIREDWARATLAAVVRKDEARPAVVQTFLRLLKEAAHPPRR
ncbi:LysR family transcriptional regulator [Nocardioides albidus]|uniref:LysR family transcriptional regulator n=1 Tax=Nocardioides albidus TaxID=1517589 RepID=A0A5C4WRF6_9ACTN|nr:LysR family transcriptional regulator [Nocardioides albidus]TNM50801.1 LysR family transcriptional regulator [Nocardioides albidus]